MDIGEYNISSKKFWKKESSENTPKNTDCLPYIVQYLKDSNSVPRSYLMYLSQMSYLDE